MRHTENMADDLSEHDQALLAVTAAEIAYEEAKAEATMSLASLQVALGLNNETDRESWSRECRPLDYRRRC